MNVVVAKRWEEFVAKLVTEGRYGSSEAVVETGLRLVQQNEAKLASLREMISRSVAEGGALTEEEVTESLDAAYARAKGEGY